MKVTWNYREKVTMKNAYVEMYDNYRKSGIATINQAKFKKSEFLE